MEVTEVGLWMKIGNLEDHEGPFTDGNRRLKHQLIVFSVDQDWGKALNWGDNKAVTDAKVEPANMNWAICGLVTGGST